MRRHERAARIQAILDEHVPDPAIPLDHRDPFTLLVAVVLSAQCTDARVNQVTPALFAEASTPQQLAALSVPRIRHHIRSCGLAPQKAKALRALAEQLVTAHGGRVPRDAAALEALPGVGHKTASVVLAQAFGVPTFPVDTHIHRLAWRWGLSSGRSVAQTERDLVRTFPQQRWNTLHLQLIWFGRTHCPALGHDPDACPICRWAMSGARRAADQRRRRAARRARGGRQSAAGRGAGPSGKSS
ncbi:MAG: endonuclease III [Planctomycetes bacterium]|nr:endonuclease III [Planctomycetota bacterium]